MRYMFVSLTIVVVWIAVIALGMLVPGNNGLTLFGVAEILTLTLFYIGFYKR